MKEYQIISVEALVVGSGAAGLNAACRIQQEGKKSVAIVTEALTGGTSRNTGSDKQTYYKLGLGGDRPDSVQLMAENLFAGGAVDGDNALCEAALSTRCFLNLCELGVPFPVNRYGEYVGYKTDHDPYARGTSAGPLTSKFMTEALEKKALELKIPIYNDLYAVEIIKNDSGVVGLLCLEKATGNYVVFRTAELVLATGGPAGIYADSVYPQCHTGSSSLAFQAGAEFQNMTEWQYGLASVNPRWNVSGTYMQVLPRFVSVDEAGVEREFLLDYFQNPYEALDAVFLKGYQWPFDSGKVMSGSSVIDLLVYRETTLRNRKVYLDYRANPFDLKEIDYERLSEETGTYLKNANACFGTPIQRLVHMNAPAVDLYRDKGLDLQNQMLEIALCAQHNNGGIAVDLWWRTNIPGLFAAGECAGTHGITRPGGSALNAGQVGSLRAAQYLSQSNRTLMEPSGFADLANAAVDKHMHFRESLLRNGDTVDVLIQNARRRMSRCGAAIRQQAQMLDALDAVKEDLKHWEMDTGVSGRDVLYKGYQYRDTLICQVVCLEAMLDFSNTVGTTRGSALYTNCNGDKLQGLEECFRFVGESKVCADRIQQGRLLENGCQFTWRSARPIPEQNDFFENIWRQYRENRNIY